MNKMYLDITRRTSTDFGTPGHAVLLNGDKQPVGFEMDTLGLPWRSNQSGKSCIKAGDYTAHKYVSPHFKRAIWKLEDKHDRKDVEIHNGNLAGDVDKDLVAHTGKIVDEQTQVHGCELTGSGYGEIDLKDAAGNLLGVKQFGILNSRPTLNAFMSATTTCDVLIVRIRWEEGARPEDDN